MPPDKRQLLGLSVDCLLGLPFLGLFGALNSSVYFKRRVYENIAVCIYMAKG